MHLEIRQSTDRVEQVPSSVISTLYNLSKHDAGLNRELDNSSYLSGNINAPVAAEKSVQALNNEWADLTVTATVYAVEFKDPEVNRILTNQYGDLTTSTVSAISDIGTLFKESTISDFSDMDQLTALNSLRVDAFQGCSNLTTINLSNIQTIAYSGGLYSCLCFYGCSSLKSVYAPSLTQAVVNGDTGNSMFNGCSQLESIDMPNLVGFGTQNNGFAANFHGGSVPMLKYVNLGHYQFNFGQGDGFHAGNFTNLSNLLIIDAGDDVKQFTDYAIQNCAALKAIVIRNTSVVPYTKKRNSVTIANAAGGSSSAYFYVPDNLVASYQAADNWSDISDRILGISSYDKDTILNS